MFRVLKRIIWNARPRPNGDNIDRLNYSVTSNILVLLIILISIKQYVGEPIQCWIPAETIPSWELYIERYCYIQNTYFVNETNLIMPSNEQKKRLELRYYQWVSVYGTKSKFRF
uniref:Innexin n=1 Tax=Panagrolaimus sp. PS1159 TaxID=55785 RepID=A0AC35GIC8_9BILA